MGRTQEHVDLDRRIVRIEASLVETAKGSELGPTKTAAGRRTDAISDVIVPDLRWHLQRFAEPGPAGRVFVGPKGASPRRNNLNALWRKAGTDAGLSAELHFHDLRHSGNTLAAATGASLAVLMRPTGHANSRAALIYQDAANERDRAIADALDQLAAVVRTRPRRRPGRRIWHGSGTRGGTGVTGPRRRPSDTAS